MLMRIVLPALALAAATPALAEPVSVVVPYGDLDLTKEAGRKALDARLARAANKVCGPVNVRDLARLSARRACIAEARASAEPQVELALNAANARRVAVLSAKLAVFAGL
ncbi:UrcA family protein [Erythrobacter sp. CCH5-A1]|uniref:UrcA family protein n=1 Tax=Erythrobacter sp. CCH5-A1 TaxID=1768792 RepID=UPI00082B59E9|nr:UrcA family protein [Erythrobacter sp. CCH5-A1]